MMYALELKNATSISGWESIFKNWHTQIQTAFDLSNGLDSPFIHAEHGNTHILGVAAALAGYGTIREVIGRRNNHDARLDLCLISAGKIDLVEAKWMEFDGKNYSKYKQIGSQLESALTDVSTYQNSHPLYANTITKRKIGVAFVVPYFSPGCFDKNDLERILRHIRSEIAPDAMAWAFPDTNRNIKYWGRDYPGVVALASVLVK